MAMGATPKKTVLLAGDPPHRPGKPTGVENTEPHEFKRRQVNHFVGYKTTAKEIPMPTMLVVDDDADTRRNMTDLFSDRGYRVDAADGGDSALEQAQGRPYDVGLL